MITLISFFFLLFFSTLFSILFSYFILEEDENNFNVILISILASSIAFILSKSINSVDSNLTYSLAIFMMIYLSINFLKSSNQTQQILFIFPAIIGLLIGFGFIFEVIILMTFLYVVKSSFTYMHTSDEFFDEEAKNEKNDK